METDVCVAHSALGLMEAGYQVVVLQDVVATTAGDEEIGLRRMRDAGAVISSAKAITYEWLRSVSNANAIFEEAGASEDTKPANILVTLRLLANIRLYGCHICGQVHSHSYIPLFLLDKLLWHALCKLYFND